MREIKIDRRIQRTREWMQLALLKLMKEMPYDKITISKITDEANIARPTYYLHFKTKDDLLISCVDKFLDQLSEEFNAFMDKFPQNIKDFIYFFFQQLEIQAVFFQEVMDAGKEYLILQRFQKYANEVGPRVIAEKQIQLNTNAQHYVIDFFSGSLFTIVMRWINQGMIYSLDSMTQFYYEMIRTAFERFLKGEIDSVFDQKSKKKL